MIYIVSITKYRYFVNGISHFPPRAAENIFCIPCRNSLDKARDVCYNTDVSAAFSAELSLRSPIPPSYVCGSTQAATQNTRSIPPALRLIFSIACPHCGQGGDIGLCEECGYRFLHRPGCPQRTAPASPRCRICGGETAAEELCSIRRPDGRTAYVCSYCVEELALYEIKELFGLSSTGELIALLSEQTP